MLDKKLEQNPDTPIPGIKPRRFNAPGRPHQSALELYQTLNLGKRELPIRYVELGLGLGQIGGETVLSPTLGFDHQTLENMAKEPFIEKGVAPWAAWEAERTGFGLGFRRAAGFPLFLPLLFTSDHYANPITELRENETTNKFKTHLSWYSPKVKILKEKGVDAHCVWHPWNYLGLRTLPRVPGRGTLLFLPHGNSGLEIDINWAGLRTELAGLPDWYQPFTVMLGAGEIRQGFHVIVREQLGLPIVTAGPMESQLFPYRFWRLLTYYSQSAGASLGSHVFYSIWAGRPHRFLDPLNISISLKRKSGEFIYLSHKERMKKAYPDTETRDRVGSFASSLTLDHQSPTEDQVAFVEECLRSSDALGRAQLTKLIWSRFFKNIRSIPELYFSKMVKVWKMIVRHGGV